MINQPKERKPYHDRKISVHGKTFYPLKDVLVLDIETKKKDINGKIEAENSETVIWGAYSYNTGKVYFGKRGQSPNKLIQQHKTIITHNGKGFDIPILEADYGINSKNGYINGITHIDLLETLRKSPSRSEKESYKKKGKRPPTGKGREAIIGEARIIGMQDNRFKDLKLGTIASHGYELFKDHEVYSKYFNEYKEEDFPYEKLSDAKWVEDNMDYIKRYLVQDLVVTKNIFEFLEKYFEPLAPFLPMKDIETLQYVHAPTGSYAYKVICHELGLEEEYGESQGTFPGAWVFLPTRESYGPKDGAGRCKDFRSQHPSHQHGMNLYTPIEKCKHKVKGVCPTSHSGDGEIFKLNGTYCGCEQGPIEQLISKWLQLKMDYKSSGDPREYTIKILINATYGISSSAIFKSIYYEHTGPDTTLMSKQSIQYVYKELDKAGYIMTYGDTDSVYLMDPHNDDDKLNKVIAGIVDKIKKTMPFTDDRYDLTTDAKFTHIYFFREGEQITKVPKVSIRRTTQEEKDMTDEQWEIEKPKKKKRRIQEIKDKGNKFKKKNYIYILEPTKDGKTKVKLNGLPILKRNAPKLAKKIYSEYLEKDIIRTQNIKFDKPYLGQLINHEVLKNKEILVSTIKVNPADSYASESQLQAQISREYFDGKGGLFKGIKHTKEGLGVGKGKHYCSINEAKDLTIDQYDYETVWKTLNPFIKKDIQKTLF